MKKILCIILSLIALFSCSALAEETADLPAIDFRGYPLGSALADMEFEDRKNIYSLYDGHAATIEELITSNATVWFDDNKNEATLLYYNFWVDEVAGYHVSDANMFFIRPVVDGMISENDDEAIFFAGKYDFLLNNKGEEAYNDLASKLTTLYGEPETKKDVRGQTVLFWYGLNDTAITLYRRRGDVTLAYVWLGAETLIEEARNAYVEPVVDNAENMSGL